MTTSKSKAATAWPPSADDRTVWEALAAPFPQEDVEILPRNVRRGDQQKYQCREGVRGASIDGIYCGGFHALSVHLHYIGHAGITSRLNDVVGPGGWELEPLSLNEQGLPRVVNGELWARLTILGVSHVDVATNFSGIQEGWGDVLRRCAMRFGVGTYLWSKSDRAEATKVGRWEAEQAEAAPPAQAPQGQPAPQPEAPAPQPGPEPDPEHQTQADVQAQPKGPRATWDRDKAQQDARANWGNVGALTAMGKWYANNVDGTPDEFLGTLRTRVQALQSPTTQTS